MTDRLKITVKCPWPWCPGTMTLSDTGSLDFLINMLRAFRDSHQACKPSFTYEATVTSEPEPSLDVARQGKGKQ